MREILSGNTVCPSSGRSSSREEIYGEVYREVLESSEARDREGFVALFPRLPAMEGSFTRWKKELGLTKKKKKVDVGNEAFDNAPVERHQTEMKFIATPQEWRAGRKG